MHCTQNLEPGQLPQTMKVISISTGAKEARFAEVATALTYSGKPSDTRLCLITVEDGDTARNVMDAIQTLGAEGATLSRTVRDNRS